MMTGKMVFLLRYWLPVVVWCSIIFVLSSIPGLKSGLDTAWDIILRKSAHVTEYAILFLLTRRALSAHVPLQVRANVWWAAVFSVLYAVSDEVHQSFVPTRGPSGYDVLVDSIGVALGVLTIMWWMRKRIRNG